MEQIYTKLRLLLLLIISMTVWGELWADCTDIDFVVDKNEGCAPQLIEFTVLNAPEGSSFQWDFGVGSTNTQDEVTYRLFNKAGTYDVTLTVTLPDNTSCDPLTKTGFITISSAPEPKISVSPDEVMCDGPEQVTITDETPDVATREFVIEGQVYEDAQQSITHNFTSAGMKNITLQVTNSAGCRTTKVFNEHIIILDQPGINFCGSIVQNDQTTSVDFTSDLSDIDPSIIESYNWTFEDGSPGTASGPNPSVTFNDVSGGKDVTLEIVTEGGCTYERTIENAIIDFVDVNPQDPCKDEKVEVVNNASTMGRSNFTWFFPGSEIIDGSATQGFTLSYSQMRQYSANMQFRHYNSCSWNVELQDIVDVQGPVAGVNIEDRTACDAPHEVTLNDNSSLPPGGTNQFYWEITNENGNHVFGSPIGPTTAPSHNLNITTEGAYDVKYVVSNTNGCSDTLTRSEYIVVQQPEVDYAIDDTLCLGTFIETENKTFPPEREHYNYSYQWFFQHSDSESVTQHFWSEEAFYLPPLPGNYDVRLSVETEGGCKDTLLTENAFHIRGIKAEIFETKSEPLNCPGDTISLDSEIIYNIPDVPDNNLSYTWQIPEFLLSQTDNAILDNIEFTTPDQPGTDVIITDTSGCFPVELLIENTYGCERIVSSEAFCIGVVGDFEFDALTVNDTTIQCSGDTLKISDKSQLDPTGYQWKVSGGEYHFASADNIPNPSIILNEDTCYEVTQIVEKVQNGKTCTDSVTRVVCTRSPDPAFTTNNTEKECAPEIFQFTNHTANETWDFTWHFGDGNTLQSNSSTVSHTFELNNPDGFNVSLVAVDENGCKDTLTRENYIQLIGAVPMFEVHQDMGCDQLTTGFDNLSEYVDKFMFDYGDGSSPDSMTINPHTYSLEPGEDSATYTATMIATDTDDCQATYSQDIKLYRAATANFEADNPNGCIPQEVTFTVQNQLNAATYHWDLTGNGAIDTTGPEVSRNYTDTGSYDIMLIAETGGTCIDTLIRDDYVNITPEPEAALSLSDDNICAPGYVSFENLSDNYTDFVIDYGQNGIKDTNTIRDFRYEYPGDPEDTDPFQIEVTLYVYNDWVCRDEVSRTLTLRPGTATEMSLSKDTVCSEEEVLVSAQSQNANQWQWDIGINGNTDHTTQNFSFQPETGETDIRLIASNPQGCRDTIERRPGVVATESPTANFEYSNQYLCEGETLTYSNQSASSVSIVHNAWIVDHPEHPDTLHQEAPPPLVYEETGTYSTTLIVTDSYNCLDTVSKHHYVLDGGISPDSPDVHYASYKDGGILLNWAMDDHPRFAGYELERQENANDFNLLSDISNRDDTTYTDESADPGGLKYCYRLRYSNECGGSSQYSEVHCPPFLNAEGHTGNANELSWDHYEGWDQIAYYVIYRKTENGTPEIIDTVNGSVNEYLDEGLCDEEYCYEVAAHHPGGKFISISNEDCSSPIYEHQDAPLRFESVSVVDNQYIDLQWEEGTQDNIERYRIDRRPMDGGWTEDHLTTDAEQTSVRDEKVDVNSRYYQYRVRVEDQCGHNSEYSNLGTSILLNGIINEDQPELTWNPYETWDNGVLRYDVEIRDNDNQFNRIDRTGGNETVYTDENIHEDIDTAYCYRVTAIEDHMEPSVSVSNIRCVVLPSRIFVPNAFSPESGHLNNVFKPNAVSVHNAIGDEHLEYTMRIYNRWGNLVFTSNDLREGWDGRMSDGSKASEGTYIYVIRARGIDYEAYNVKGTLHLFRYD